MDVRRLRLKKGLTHSKRKTAGKVQNIFGNPLRLKLGPRKGGGDQFRTRFSQVRVTIIFPSQVKASGR